ncbi:2-oxoglutarate ferredoxin oxidoreductase, gamma subunit [Caminicella sporogenes DSM 14501]|uniref:2-oxoglutarate ferredoxin oxidoreductase, gamma subunit n=1 Tax=Caminicella sporogenes DSM 14501 TaxID=1121266 RepID=A0A1M6L4Q5_9FIRM|nr:2-oxoacid:acceptor oxidoreductase family protein [Caminicella sporogenes]RKD27704.1 2-oxoglutarate ferredoxin oxidoreductase subunit gamma [Caminicella sporogenes]WIF94719.1 2-oxoacid:acceptor oxidoreductase family protein [Caminicella sporogenes]SHJ66170.1 2-oxoglutarate ferredoxin oxidoreductase, gamma subunit [Caminicella sporogenes DSM 14501]
MAMQTEIRLTGSGGQGLILGGIILAEAAILQGHNAIQSQSYGPEARGGASKAEVIISENEIDFPKVEKADILLALTQVAFDKYKDSLKEDGILVVDSSIEISENLKAKKIVSAPILKTASDVVGKSMVANIVALGVIQELSNIVTKEELEKAVLNRVPKGTEELNRKALEEGYKLVKSV